MNGYFGALSAWCEAGLVLCGFAVLRQNATAKLGRVPAWARHAAANDRAPREIA